VRIEHRLDGGDVVLQVRVDADDDVALGREQAREQRILVPAVAGELDSAHEAVRLRERLDDAQVRSRLPSSTKYTELSRRSFGFDAGRG
jgi:hypothetical protein